MKVAKVGELSTALNPRVMLRRMGWGVADQGVSSMSNFALGIIVARSLGPEGFGSFSLAFITYSFILCASRGLATDPLVVRFSHAEPGAWRRAVAASSATSVLIGLTVGLACITIGLALPPEVRGGFIALGVCLPWLLLQDTWRFAFFAAGRPAEALLNDAVWGTLQVAGLVVLLTTGHAGVASCFLVFGGTGALAAGFGLLQLRIRPRPSLVRSWLVDHKSLGPRYLVENLSIGGARQIRFMVLGAAVSLAAVGAVRGAEILMGPFLVMLSGVSQMAVPEAAHVLVRSPRRLQHFCLAVGGCGAVAAAAWGITIAALLPLGVGQALLGSLWVPASQLLLPVILGLVLGGFEIGAAAGVRALGAAPRSLKAQLISASMYLIGGVGGALVAGAWGSCWGVAVATALGAGVWWFQLRRAHAEFMMDVDVAWARSHPEGVTT